MMINAKEFGLKGKSKSADTRAMQRALNYAKKYPSTTIYVPKGEFHIRKSLVIYESTTLLLDKSAVLKRCGKDALLKMVEDLNLTMVITATAIFILQEEHLI